MRSFFVSFLFFLIWFLVAFVYLSNETTPRLISIFNELFNKKELSENTGIQTISETIEQEGLPVENQALLHIFNEKTDYLFSLDSMYFKKNIDSVFYQNESEFYLDPLINYFLSNEPLEMLIESDYSATERFETPNLGIKRGEYLSKMIVKQGVDPALIKVKSNIKDLNFNTENKIFGGIQIQLKPIDSTRMAEIEKDKLVQKVVYPNFTFSGIVANQELNDFADELKIILNQNPNKKVQIIGHTDNIGSAVDNYQQGLKYARQVMWYLINKKGFEQSSLSASSKGEESPIDDNNTQTGRKNNLRIEFIIE